MNCPVLSLEALRTSGLLWWSISLKSSSVNQRFTESTNRSETKALEGCVTSLSLSIEVEEYLGIHDHIKNRIGDVRTEERKLIVRCQN